MAPVSLPDQEPLLDPGRFINTTGSASSERCATTTGSRPWPGTWRSVERVDVRVSPLSYRRLVDQHEHCGRRVQLSGVPPMLLNSGRRRSRCPVQQRSDAEARVVTEDGLYRGDSGRLVGPFHSRGESAPDPDVAVPREEQTDGGVAG